MFVLFRIDEYRSTSYVGSFSTSLEADKHAVELVFTPLVHRICNENYITKDFEKRYIECDYNNKKLRDEFLDEFKENSEYLLNIFWDTCQPSDYVYGIVEVPDKIET